MQTTANYGFNIVEGTDIVNPLTQLNPNFTALDTDLKDVSDATYDKATCVKSGTNHAVTRTDTDKNLIIFTATGNWETGDTMTIDGSPVSVYLPDGTAALTGSFIINTEVMMIKNGSRVTLYTDQKLPGYDAVDIDYDNSTSGLTANNVQGAIDELGQNPRGGAYFTNISGGSKITLQRQNPNDSTLISLQHNGGADEILTIIWVGNKAARLLDETGGYVSIAAVNATDLVINSPYQYARVSFIPGSSKVDLTIEALS